MGSKNAHRAHKKQRTMLAFTFLQEFAYVSFVNVEIKQQKKLKKFTQMLSASNLMATVFWNRKGVLMM
jgi:hypothetical protein